MTAHITRFLLPTLAALLCANAQAAPPAVPLPRDSVYQLPVQLTDQDNRTRSWHTRRGKPQLVAMFYTSCQYVCPLIVEGARAVDRQLTPAQQRNMEILLVSMDPARDDAAALKQVATQRRLDARWTLAAPPLPEVREVAGVLGVRYRELADGEFNHTSALVLLDAQGRVLARTERVGTLPDPTFLAAVRKATSP